MVCELEVAKLSARGQRISEMLLPITGSPRLAYSLVPQRNEIVIAVHSGSRPVTDPREWRFTTPVLRMRGAYFERWVPNTEKRKDYHLLQAYLHLYWRERGEHRDQESEILALHCDPNEPNDEGLTNHARYKRGPHIHVVAARQPLPHAHFALNAGHLSEVLASLERLSAAVASGVNLIRDQVLDLYDAGGF